MRRFLVPALPLVAVAALVAGWWTYRIGEWGSYEHRLHATLAKPGNRCARVTDAHDGWGGPGAPTPVLDRTARDRYSVFCEVGGPSLGWLRYPDATTMRDALARTHFNRLTSVCVSRSRAEVLIADGVSLRTLSRLCDDRDGNVVVYRGTDGMGNPP